jgi:hypothetical protein
MVSPPLLTDVPGIPNCLLDQTEKEQISRIFISFFQKNEPGTLVASFVKKNMETITKQYLIIFHRCEKVVRFLGMRISPEMHPLTWLKDREPVVGVRHFNSAKDQPFTWRKYREQYRKYSCSSAGEQRTEPEVQLFTILKQ